MPPRLCCKDDKFNQFFEILRKVSYNLRSLNEVETFIKANGHLPEIPSETEVKDKGVNIAEMQAKLLQKVEELTLYVIELKKENNLMKAHMQSLERGK